MFTEHRQEKKKNAQTQAQTHTSSRRGNSALNKTKLIGGTCLPRAHTYTHPRSACFWRHDFQKPSLCSETASGKHTCLDLMSFQKSININERVGVGRGAQWSEPSAPRTLGVVEVSKAPTEHSKPRTLEPCEPSYSLNPQQTSREPTKADISGAIAVESSSGHLEFVRGFARRWACRTSGQADCSEGSVGV